MTTFSIGDEVRLHDGRKGVVKFVNGSFLTVTARDRKSHRNTTSFVKDYDCTLIASPGEPLTATEVATEKPRFIALDNLNSKQDGVPTTETTPLVKGDRVKLVAVLPMYASALSPVRKLLGEHGTVTKITTQPANGYPTIGVEFDKPNVFGVTYFYRNELHKLNATQFEPPRVMALFTVGQSVRVRLDAEIPKYLVATPGMVGEIQVVGRAYNLVQFPGMGFRVPLLNSELEAFTPKPVPREYDFTAPGPITAVIAEAKKLGKIPKGATLVFQEGDTAIEVVRALYQLAIAFPTLHAEHVTMTTVKSK